MNVIFDWTITAGNIATVLTMFAGGVVFIVTLRADLITIGRRLERVESGMSQITDALIQLAKQEERLNAHADRLSRLENE